jgi:hypothetical protein
MVDLSKLKVGDKVKYRTGIIDEVINVVKNSQGDTYDYTVSLLSTTWGYKTDGSFSCTPDLLDIVEIMPNKPEALRFNKGKTPYGNLPLDLLDGAARVMAYGANKYGDSENFRKGYSDLLSPLDSLIRHTVALQRAIQTDDYENDLGFLLDNESKEAHIHHVITSTLMLIHSMRLAGFKV